MLINADEGTKLLNKAKKAFFEHDYIMALEHYKAAAALGRVEALGEIINRECFGDRSCNAFSADEIKNATKQLFDLVYEGDEEALEIMSESIAKFNPEDRAKAFDICLEEAESGYFSYLHYIVFHEAYLKIDAQEKLKAFKIINRIANDDDDADMIFFVGHMHKIGYGVPKNIKEAVKHFQKANELGSDEAAYQLAAMYDNGEFFTKDFTKALELYNKAADRGNSAALWKLTYAYSTGDAELGIAPDKDKMVELMFKAADDGTLRPLSAILDLDYVYDPKFYDILSPEDNAMAVKLLEKLISKSEIIENSKYLVLLGCFYCRGNSIEKNYKRAIELFEKAIEFDDLNAMMKLSELYYEGLGVEKDREKAFALRKLITEYEDYFVNMDSGEEQILPAMVLVAKSYREGDGIRQSGVEAFKWYKKAEAYSDHAFHRYDGENDELIGIIKNAIGEMYENHELYLSEQLDDNIKDKDYKMAADYFEAAIKLRNASAMASLAKKYRDGRGVVKDDEKAFELAKEAVETDGENVAALKTLALMYDEGIGTDYNDEESFNLYTKAAELNDIEAITILAHKSESYPGKIQWYEKLVELGDKDAIRIIEKLKTKLELLSRAAALEEDEKYDDAIEEYKKAAELGSYYAMSRLAAIYYNGQCGVETNYDEALKWHEMAAAADEDFPLQSMRSPVNAVFASDIYLEKKNDGINAIKWMKKMAELDPLNISSIGDMYYYPQYYYQKVDPDTYNYIRSTVPTIEQNYVKAFQYYEEADKAGSPSGTHKLAKCYLKGEGVAQDKEKARQLFERNVEENDFTNSMVELAQIYQLKAYELYREILKRQDKGEGVSNLNNDAVILACEAAMRLGNKDAISDVGKLGEQCYQNRNNVKEYFWMKATDENEETDENKGLRLMIEAAQLGYTDPLCNVAESFNAETDFDKAVKFNELAANYGNINSMRNLAELWHGVDNDEAIKWFTKAGDSGNDWCAATLATMYLSGDIVDKDYRKAREYYEKALADEDIFNTYAAESLADMYFSNDYACQNEDKALELYKKLAEYDNGNPEFMLKLARIYRGKRERRRDTYEWFKKYAEKVEAVPEELKPEFFEVCLFAAEYGDIYAMTDVADCYANGFGTPQDLKQAFYWHNKAANPKSVSSISKRRSIKSVIALALMYRDGAGVEKDVIKAYNILKSILNEKDVNIDKKEWIDTCISAAENGDKEALQDLSKIAIFNRDFPLIKKAVDLGNIKCMAEIAKAYMEGDGVDKDLSKAVHYYQKAVELNDADCAYELAMLYYEQGQEIECDSKRAFELFFELLNKAANLGHLGAMRKLEFGYLYGSYGIKKDPIKAYEWHKRYEEFWNKMIYSDSSNFDICFEAAEAGCKEAMLDVARMYETGTGAAVDLQQANFWRSKAAS